ncbi:hypothetical protein E8L99_12335 [Phreatobacter aquaticus]|uniref:Uncharacterized protein n=1 Tax=Phreatobacter aquaticus TaxID=2570229 RepID=A0A4D7QMF8_9HYPH|nr:hypothetical protein [Phreatobacter aquaticus]QCK86484.1 hypothetical protein E8L99_12335 [Phreatobacter aquaticus]
MAINLGAIFADDDLTVHLGLLSEIEPPYDGDKPLLSTIDGETDVIIVARTGSGGQFIRTASQPRLFYCSSEGQAGLLADDLDGLMTLIVRCPEWQSVLKYSGGGRLDEMRRAAAILDEHWSVDDEAVSARDQLSTHLGLDVQRDIIADLHRAISTTVEIRDLWGQACLPLAGTYTIDDNPMV